MPTAIENHINTALFDQTLNTCLFLKKMALVLDSIFVFLTECFVPFFRMVLFVPSPTTEQKSRWL